MAIMRFGAKDTMRNGTDSYEEQNENSIIHQSRGRTVKKNVLMMMSAVVVLMILTSGIICLFSDGDSSAATTTTVVTKSITVETGEPISVTLTAPEKISANRSSVYFINNNGVAESITYEIDANLGIDNHNRWIKPEITFGGTAPTESGFYEKIVYVGLDGTNTVQCKFFLTLNVIEPKETYTVSFSVDGGTPCNSQSVLEGNSIILPSTTRTDYKFEGWYEGSRKVGDAGTTYTPTSSVTLSASWTSTVVVSYTVIFNTGGGSSCSVQSVTQGLSITLPDTSKTGCTFLGWYTSGGSPVGDAGAEYIPASSVTLYAKWSQITQYKVSFNTDAGTTVDTKTCDSGSYITLPSVTKPNYSFIGWYTAATGGVLVQSPYKVVGDITLYAQWTIYEIVINALSEDYQFSVTLFSNGVVTNIISGTYSWYLDSINVQKSTLNTYKVEKPTAGLHTIKVVVELTNIIPSVTIEDKMSFTVASEPDTPDTPDTPDKGYSVFDIIFLIIAAVLLLIVIWRTL